MDEQTVNSRVLKMMEILKNKKWSEISEENKNLMVGVLVSVGGWGQ